MITINKMGHALLLGACLSVTACSVPGSRVAGIDQRGDDVIDRTSGALDEFGETEFRRGGGAQVSEGVYLAAVKERSNQAALLPSRVQTPNGIVIASRDPLNLRQISERLTLATGIEHVVALGPSGDSGADPDRTLRPTYSGKLSDVLDKISANFGVEWQFSEGKVIFRNYITRQYQVPVIPSVAAGGSTVGEATSGYTADFWTEFEDSVSGILGEDVVHSISRSTGILTVTARVNDHVDIRDYITEIAKNMTQQISFDVNVLSVSLTDTDAAGLDLNMVLSDIAGGVLQIGSNQRLDVANSNANLAVIKGDVNFRAIVTALSKQGKVSTDTRTGVTTVNNRPVPVEVIDTVSYVASIQQETDPDTNVTRYIPVPATQDVGFMLQLYPRIMNSNEIMVEYSISLSELKALERFGEAESMIQLPEVSSTNFSQQTVLENGHTLILSGFERNRRSITRDSSISSGGLFGFGRRKEALEERVATVVMIRPRILQNGRAITSGEN